MRRLLLVLVPLLAANAHAQIGRGRLPRAQQPTAFVSFDVGLSQGFTVNDGSTSSIWNFSDAPRYGVALEKNLSSGASLGVRGNTARVPLRYRADYGDVLEDFDADANVSQLFATLHVASGGTLHSVLEIAAGATLYSNFRARGTAMKLGPASPDADFSFVFGYGLGYAFSPRFSVDVVQDLTTTLHQKTGLSAGEDTSIRLNTTRLVARFGIGG